MMRFELMIPSDSGTKSDRWFSNIPMLEERERDSREGEGGGEELETRGEYEKVEHVTLRAERHGRKLKSYFAVVKFPRYETRKSCY